MIDDGPKVNRLEAAVALSTEAIGDGVLCAGSFQRLSITAFDDANNDSWALSDSSYEVSSTPPIGLVKRGDGKLDAQSPVPGQPEYAGQPVTIRFKYLPPNDPGRPPPPPGATTELVLPQSLTCGEPTEIDLKGDDGLGGAPCGDTKNDGKPGSEGQPGSKRGKDAKVTTTVVAAAKLGLINAYVAKHPAIQLIE